jgi:hypothetical protein
MKSLIPKSIKSGVEPDANEQCDETVDHGVYPSWAEKIIRENKGGNETQEQHLLIPVHSRAILVS